MNTNAVTSDAPAPSTLNEAVETGFLPEDPHYRLTGEFPKESEKKDQDLSVKEGASAASGADTDAAPAAVQSQEKKGKTQATSESRWAKITRENKELREQLARERASKPAEQRETQQASQPAAETKSGSRPEPKLDDVDPKTNKAKYANWQEYQSDLRAWDREEALRQFQETSAKTQREQAQQQAERTLAEGMVKKFEATRAKYADFDEVALNDNLIIPRGSVADAFLLDSDHAGEVAYYLGQHPDILEDFYADNDPKTGRFTNRITPQRQFRKLMEIEAEFSKKPAPVTPAKPITQAPRPPQQTSGKGTVGKDPIEQAVEDVDSETYIRAQNERDLARRRKGR